MYSLSGVGFVLTIARGPGAGEEFTFEREARLGRTSDNDVVVRDSSVSRSHARVFVKGSRHFVEDLGSANGTQVNDTPISAPRELKSGDRVAIGDAVVQFAVAQATLLQGDATMEVDSADVNETAIPSRSSRASRRPTSSTARARPEPRDEDETGAAPPDEPDEPEDEEQEEAPAPDESSASGEEGSEGPEESQEAEEPEGLGEVPRRLDNRTSRVPRPRSLARPAVAAPARQPVRGPALARPRPPEDDELSGMTAAEKRRRQRALQQSASGQVQLLWEKLGGPMRVVLILFIVLFGSALAGGAGWLVWQQSKGHARKAEPATLTPNAPPLPDSFGQGDGVTFRRPDLKAFTFSITSPTKVVGVLHYQARAISKDEVVVSLNGHELGTVPPDSLDVDTRELFLVLPSTQLVLREDNTLTFDNVLNPPGEEEWRLWNVWVEIIPVPDMTPDEAGRAANDAIAKGAKAYELRDVGAGNLFHSWKTYREAWLLLEATPNRNEELHQIAHTRMLEIRPELDRRCSAMLVEFKKVINQRPQDIDRARAVLREIPDYFPTREHPCNTFASSLLSELDEVAAPEER